MGGGTWSDDAYRTLAKDYSTKTRDQVFTSKTINADMNPRGVKFRESRDSDVHPNSLAIAVNLDVTGSMGNIPEQLIKHKLGVLLNTLIDHGVPDAHVLFAGIGDHYSDSSPLQVGQFEAGTDELNKWLTSIYLEGNGGGQTMESYMLAWLFAARHTSIDCYEKRNEKGFLFTIGDEWVHPTLEAAKIKELLGYDVGEDISTVQLLSEAQRMYNVFHLHIHETSTGRGQDIIDHWKNLMGERVLIVEDYNTVAEIIASTVAVVRGAELSKIVSSFDHKIAGQVSTALMHITTDLSLKDKGIISL